MENLSKEQLENIIEQAEQHAAIYVGTKDGSYNACLAAYNYWNVKKELLRRQNETN